jgi:addiction module HigA family antidote
MNERNLTVTELAKGLGMTRANVPVVINGRAGISPEMVVKLSAAFANSATFWTNLQTNYELWHAEKKVKRSKIRHFKLPTNRQSGYA